MKSHNWVKIREAKPTLHRTWCCPGCGHRITTRGTRIKLDKLKKTTPEGLLGHIEVPTDCREASVHKIMTV